MAQAWISCGNMTLVNSSFVRRFYVTGCVDRNAYADEGSIRRHAFWYVVAELEDGAKQVVAEAPDQGAAGKVLAELAGRVGAGKLGCKGGEQDYADLMARPVS